MTFKRSKVSQSVLAVVVALACAWGLQASALAAGITLPVLLVPQNEGDQAAYVIVEESFQQVANISGFFQVVTPEEETYDERAVRVHYTVLSVAPDVARLLVRAQPINPQTHLPISPVRWEVVYVITPEGVYPEEEVEISAVYWDLVEPAWLADWSAASNEDLPKGEIQPGDSWTAIPNADLSELIGEAGEVPLTGRFVGWQEIPGVSGHVAHIEERLSTTEFGRQEMFENVFVDQTIDLVIGVDQWLIPDEFPYGLERSVSVASRSVVGPETGAPVGFEGAFDVVFHMTQSIEADPDAHVVWLEWEDDTELSAGTTVWGVLGPWSDRYEDDGTYVHQYTYRGREGERLSVRLHSLDFDAYLFLFTDAYELVANDDDSGGGTDSLISVELPHDGTYIIVVNTLFEGEEGRYALTIE